MSRALSNAPAIAPGDGLPRYDIVSMRGRRGRAGWDYIRSGNDLTELIEGCQSAIDRGDLEPVYIVEVNTQKIVWKGWEGVSMLDCALYGCYQPSTRVGHDGNRYCSVYHELLDSNHRLDQYKAQRDRAVELLRQAMPGLARGGASEVLGRIDAFFEAHGFAEQETSDE